MTAASPPRLQALTRLKGDLYRIEVRVGRKTLQASLRLDGSMPPPSEWTIGDLVPKILNSFRVPTGYHPAA